MAVSSMTGFARAHGGTDALGWTWEIKSVNGRGLDVRCRVPQGFEALEPASRRVVSDALSRGNVAVNLQVSRGAAAGTLQINEAVLQQLAELSLAMQERYGLERPRIDGLLGVRGVVELVDPEDTPEAREQREAAMLEDLKQALKLLQADRQAEGTRLAGIVSGQLEQLDTLVGRANAVAYTQPAAIQQRLQQQLAELLDADSAVVPERLEQEIALLATKADIREELDRLAAHLEAVRELMGGKGAVGRRLDFLAQELNREANTLCSKSQDVELTRIGIELKTVIDQFREQAQNIE